MLKQIAQPLLYIALLTTSAVARTNNVVSKFSPSGTLVDSSITELNGNVGVQTQTPTGRLDIGGYGGLVVAGSNIDPRGGYSLEPLKDSGRALLGWNYSGGEGEVDILANRAAGASGGFRFYDYSNAGALTNLFTLRGDGRVGIGTMYPIAPLNVAIGTVANANEVYNALVVQPAQGAAQFGNGASIFLSSVANSRIAPVAGIWSSLGSGGNGGYTYSGALVLGTTREGNSVPIEAMRVDQFGNVGIVTTTPTALLEVKGNIKLSGNSGGGIIFPDGAVQSTAWTGSLCGGDYAESVDVSGSRTNYEPGDVLVIDPAHPGSFLKSNARYSRLVAGIYSMKPGVVGRRQTTDPKLSTNEVPMAMVGIVPTKVTAENGPVEVGDLLVSSSLPAHAMKAGDGVIPTGTVIGKALGELTSGTGVIEVLVSLQ
ncbi:hypothetical protein [Granulicella sp. dw_53]|uniref:hypothetical protein n=1 Tax=Granulicella sp. dw_53 TaxID=2719792 RepID=UPI001BD4537C|nr:hypothetical protein [Granulicella sp. dw_53]